MKELVRACGVSLCGTIFGCSCCFGGISWSTEKQGKFPQTFWYHAWKQEKANEKANYDPMFLYVTMCHHDSMLPHTSAFFHCPVSALLQTRVQFSVKILPFACSSEFIRVHPIRENTKPVWCRCGAKALPPPMVGVKAALVLPACHEQMRCRTRVAELAGLVGSHLFFSFYMSYSFIFLTNLTNLTDLIIHFILSEFLSAFISYCRSCWRSSRRTGNRCWRWRVSMAIGARSWLCTCNLWMTCLLKKEAGIGLYVSFVLCFMQYNHFCFQTHRFLYMLDLLWL